MILYYDEEADELRAENGELIDGVIVTDRIVNDPVTQVKFTLLCHAWPAESELVTGAERLAQLAERSTDVRDD